MNITERAARKWLARENGVREHEIIYNRTVTPDFKLPDGSLYEVKRLYGDKVIFYPTQIKALSRHPQCRILIFGKDSDSPVAIMPAGELGKAVEESVWRSVRVVVALPLGLTKYQIYLTPQLQEAFDRYIKEQFGPHEHVASALFRKAMEEFLEKRGYLSTEGVR